MSHHSSPATKDVLIYGNHPVTLALKNRRRHVLEVYYTRDAALPATISAPTKCVAKDFLDKLVGPDVVHQGIVARVSPLEQLAPDDIIRHLEKQDSAVVMILDQVTDPHNIGAILRSNVAFDSSAVFVPETGTPDETGTLAKSASGALELIPYIRVSNLSRLIDKLKEAGFWCIGLDGYADQSIATTKLPNKCAFIMGSEGSGMRQLTQKKCDYCVKLPMNPAIESLNVSNAAALTLYEYRRQYPSR